MSRMTTIEEQEELIDFARKAAASFASNESLATFAYNNPAEGQLLALRWGRGNDCVLVVRLDEDFEPINYQQAIKT